MQFLVTSRQAGLQKCWAVPSLQQTLDKGGEPICFHRLLKLWNNDGGRQITTDCILKFHFSYYEVLKIHNTFYHMYLVIMELRFKVSLYSNWEIKLIWAISNVHAGHKFTTPALDEPKSYFPQCIPP